MFAEEFRCLERSGVPAGEQPSDERRSGQPETGVELRTFAIADIGFPLLRVGPEVVAERYAVTRR